MSTRTQAPRAARAHHRRMLWSDPDDEPPEDMRATQAMLRRAGVLLAVAMLFLMLATGLR